MTDKNRRIAGVAVAAAMLAASFQVSAQRQTAGRSSFDLSARPALSQLGASLGWTRWGYSSALITTAGMYTYDLPFEYHAYRWEGSRIEKDPDVVLPFEMSCTDILAGIGGLHRLASTRSRSVILSAGGTFDLGVRLYGVFREAPAYPSAPAGSEDWAIPDGMNETPSSLTAGGTTFVYGLSPVVQLELFPFRGVSLCLRGIPRMQFANAYGEGWFIPDMSAGINIYL